MEAPRRNRRGAFAVSTSLSGGGYGNVEAAGVTVTVTDDDAFGFTISKTELHVPPGGRATYEVKLDSKPTHPVTVIVENGNNRLFVSVDGKQYQSGLPAELVFTSKGSKTVEVLNDGFRGTHTLRHRTISDDANYGDKKWADVVIHEARKATVALSAPDQLFVGDPGVITATIDEPALPYNLNVNLSIPGARDRDLLGLGEDITITIKAGALSVETPFTIATGQVERPDYRCNGGRSRALVWISSSYNYSSANVLEPVIIRVLHGDFKAGGRCEGN